MIDGSRGQGRRNWCPCRRRRAAGTGWDSWRRGSWRVGSSHVRQAPIWVEEVGMTRSDRRIDRPHFRTFRRQDRAGGCHTWRCCVVFLPVSAATCDLADIHRRSHAGYRCARELSLPSRRGTSLPTPTPGHSQTVWVTFVITWQETPQRHHPGLQSTSPINPAFGQVTCHCMARTAHGVGVASLRHC